MSLLASTLIEDYLVEYSNLKGWWLTPDSKLIDVSSDGGPGDHMGFLTMGDNPEKFGLSPEEGDDINKMYDYSVVRPITNKNVVDAEKAIKKVFNRGFIRLIYNPNNKIFAVQILKLDDSIIRKTKSAIRRLNLKFEKIVFEDSDYRDVILAIHFDDFENSETVSDLNRYKLRGRF